MGFNSVYKVLQEIFPQVDSRILRAIAIENSKDADVAVGIVLAEVLPSLSIQSGTSKQDPISLNPLEVVLVQASNTAEKDSAGVIYGVHEEVIAEEDLPKKPEEFGKVEIDMLCMNPNASGPKSGANKGEDQVFVDAFGEFGENIVSTRSEDSLKDLRKTSMLANYSSHLLNDTDGFVNSSSLHEEEQSSFDELVRKNHRSVTQLAEADLSAVQSFSVNNLVSNNKLLTGPVSPVPTDKQPEADLPSVSLSGEYVSFSDMVDRENGNIMNSVSDIAIKDIETQEMDGLEVETSMKANSTRRSGQMSTTELLEDVDRENGNIMNSVSDMTIKDLETREQNGVHGLLLTEMDGLEVETSMKANSTSRSGQMSTTELLEDVDRENGNFMNSVSDMTIKDLETQEQNGVHGLLLTEMDGLEFETSTKANSTSRSGQMSTTELLEDIIENEKMEKIALRSAKDSLLSFFSEVEVREKSVEKAKEAAAHGGLDTLARVEDLKKMLQRAKEANEMHAGEVYGEKAILSTEMRELQSRLHSLSEERGKALNILDQMRQELEARLALAEEEIKETEVEKLKKEESALNYLAHEESSMQKVVQESKILEQQAEENSKLRDFLMDRGRLVDMLQGEISVICQDVKLMKAKFDQRIPLSKSLSSSQTTSISTSSTSSINGASFEKVPEVVASPDNQNASLSNSNDTQLLSGDGISGTGKEFVDDDWELFDLINSARGGHV